MHCLQVFYDETLIMMPFEFLLLNMTTLSYALILASNMTLFVVSCHICALVC